MRRVLVGGTVVLLLLAVTVVVLGALLSVAVTGNSMRPTLADGDRIVVNPFDRTPRRLQLVVARFTDNGPAVVKRVAALPGDRIRIDVEAGRATVLVQPAGTDAWHLIHNPAWDDGWRRPATAMPVTLVPEDALFLLGDNPDGSTDSRTLGWAPLRLVRGTVALRVHPVADAGRPPNRTALHPAS